jgi:hypothetical protein
MEVVIARRLFALCMAVFATASLPASEATKEEPARPPVKAAETTAKVTVRDVNLYVMSAYGNSLNNRDLFKSTLPGFVGARRATAERKQLNNPSPAGLITFEGDATDDVDVLLEFTNGRFFGNWPPCPQKSKRLLWVKSKLTREAAEPVSPLPEKHWMTFLRGSDRLWFESGRRSERFIIYDAELPLPTPVKVTLVEGGHGLANTGKYNLHDVAVYKPDGDKWRVGSLPLLEAPPKKEEKPVNKDGKDKKKPDPEAVFDDKQKEQKPKEAKAGQEQKGDAAKDKDASTGKAEATPATPAPAAAAPAPVVVASPSPGQPTPLVTGKPVDGKPAPGEKKPDDAKVVSVPSSKEGQTREAIVAAWSVRLKELGCGPVEVEYLSQQIASQALRTDSATIIFRLDEEQLEEIFPLEVTPAPQKQVRVALVVLLDSDPDVAKRVEELVKKLGDPSYKEREAAMEALRKLGPAEKQKVQEGVNDKDAEVAFRAEQLVEQLNDPAGQAAAQPAPSL